MKRLARLVRPARLARDRRGSAAVEMAMVTPLLLILLMGSTELGNYFMDQHILLKGVRDGARYAARQDFSNYSACSGSPPQSVIDNTKLMVRKGSLNSADEDLLPNWGAQGATFTVTTSCATTVSSQSMSGIYKDMTNGAVKVEVEATLPYQPVLSAFGFKGIGLNISATNRAAVSGI